jgi:hypothetical protein
MSFQASFHKRNRIKAGRMGNQGVLQPKNRSHPQTPQRTENDQTNRTQHVHSQTTEQSDEKTMAPPPTQRALDSSGKELDSNTRTFMESRFSHDFSNIRVHTDAKAAASARAVGARAYTFGNHIVFDAGEYKPTTLIGDALIAHELAHSIQQQDAANRQTEVLGHSDPGLETEADNGALEVIRNRLGLAKASIFGLKRNVGIRMRTGLHLQRCVRKKLTDKEKYEEVKKKIADAEKGFRIASDTLSDNEAAKKAGNVADTLGKVNKAIDTYEKGVVIFEGIQNLKDLSQTDPYKDPERFARESGETLASFGKVMKFSKIPGISAYGEFLSHAGDFFVNMRKALDPSIRWRKQFEQIERESPTATKRGAQ